MTKIAIKFGYPSSIEEQELLSQRAVEKDCSVEHALCFEFGRLADSLVKPRVNCCQFRSTTKESFSIVNHCSKLG
jgi:hypothetical protein